MLALLVLFLAVDVLAALYFYKEAFIVRSNMRRKNRSRLLILLAIIIGSLLMISRDLKVAVLLAGTPAVLLVLFIAALGIAMFTHKGPWH